MLKPSTLVGSELAPPVGQAKDWMWNGNTVVQFLTSMLGAEGCCPLALHSVLLQLIGVHTGVLEGPNQCRPAQYQATFHISR